MPMPDDIKNAVDDSPEGDLTYSVPAGADIPDLVWFEQKMMKVRDDIARHTGAEPENVQLIGIRVFYKVGEEIEDGKSYFAVGTRCKYDPRYEKILEQL